MRCAGSGAGGSILMDVTEFNYNRDFIVHAEGANCLHQNDIISGGAGSGGYFLLRFDYLKNETHQI